MGNTTASLTHEQLFGGGRGVTIDGAAEIQSELRDRRDKKPSSELNFAPSKAGRVACFDEKRCYITDGELKPLAYFDADAYIAACGISDDGSVALFMTAYGPSGESTMLIDANTFSTIAAGAVQVSANTVRGINVDSARKKFTLFTAKKRETGWSEKLGFTFALEPTAPADKPQEIPDYGGMRTAASILWPWASSPPSISRRWASTGMTAAPSYTPIPAMQRQRGCAMPRGTTPAPPTRSSFCRPSAGVAPGMQTVQPRRCSSGCWG